MTRPLLVPVTEGFILDAGRVRVTPGEEGPVRRIAPPDRPLFDQLVAFLRGRSAGRPPSNSDEGVAWALLALRWGSYLAVLSDRAKPLWVGARYEEVSQISDPEMARINVEMSYAVGRLVDLRYEDPDAYWDLIACAVTHLPSIRATTHRDGSFRGMVARGQAVLEQRRPTVGGTTRAVANLITLWAFRNGPVQAIHTGRAPFSLPLTARRLTPTMERTVFAHSAARLAEAAWSLPLPGSTPDEYPQDLVAYEAALVAGAWAPAGWTLTDRCRPVTLDGAEPDVAGALVLRDPAALDRMRAAGLAVPPEWPVPPSDPTA